MEIERRDADRATILALAGELDWTCLAGVGEEVDALVQQGRTNLVFNLSGLKFADSSAVGFLIKTHKQLRDAAGALVLSEPSPFFQATVQTLGVDRLSHLYPDDEAALKHFDDAPARR